MKVIVAKVAAVLVAALVSASLVVVFGSTSSIDIGPPGTGMDLVSKKKDVAAQQVANTVPAPLPAASQDGQLSVDAYKNVQVLGHLSTGEMTRLMTAMTIWVAPQQGCAYCHAPQKDAAGNVVKDDEGYVLADQNRLDSDELYAKRVARRMLQMTMHVNSDWKGHVKATGVTCYTCHRGNPVPANIWFEPPPDANASWMVASFTEKNHPSAAVGWTALPSDPFTPYLSNDEGIRVISTAALPIDNNHSIKETEWTYGLMMNMSQSLGVNCTYCHNTRSFAEWSVSPPARTQAWYGIRMVRDLNKNYLEPLASVLPPERYGPSGDGPKLNCATCHNGANKPLLGISMLKDYVALAEAKPQPAKTPPPPPPEPPPPPAPPAPKHKK